MPDGNASADNSSLETQRLELERYKARLDFRKFIWGSVFAAIVIATIPPSFQYATAHLEYVKGEAARLMQAQQFRDGYVKEFLTTALNQDVEQRIRFAKYFSSVSAEKDDWAKYLDDLTKLRESKKLEIDELEQARQKLLDQQNPDLNAVYKAKRHLDWAYAEVGYAELNRSAIANPRSPDDSKAPTLSLATVPAGRRELAQKVLDAFAAAGFGQFQQIAALANAIADSNLDPHAHSASGGTDDSWGLFQLNRNGGFGAGRSPEELQDPTTNVGIVVNEAKKQPAFQAAASLDEAVDAFVRRIIRPTNVSTEVVRRQQIARQLFRG